MNDCWMLTKNLIYLLSRRNSSITFYPPAQYTDTSESPGDIITIEGKVVGRHQGLWYYTIGQKARLAGQDARYFVAKKDVERNQVVVVPGR